MSWTNATLTTAIQDYIESSESTLVSNIPNFIKTAEERILKGTQLDYFRKNVTGVGTSGNTYLAMPSDFLTPFSLAVIDSNGSYNYLLQKHVSFIRDYTPIETTTGQPKYYAEFDNTSFIIAPTPNSGFTFELHYFYRPNSLTTDTSGTWLSENAINAMLYGSLVEAAMYIKSFDSIALYEQKFQEALLMLKNIAEGSSTRDQYRYDQIRREPQA